MGQIKIAKTLGIGVSTVQRVVGNRSQAAGNNEGYRPLLGR